MLRRAVLSSSLASVIAVTGARAQESPKPVRIGWLTAQTQASLAPYVEAFRAGLGRLGLVEGRTLTIEYAYGEDSLEKVPALATQLIRNGARLIVAQGAAVPLLAKQQLPVPVVYVFSGDPVSAGLAETLARPKGNMTGLTFMAAELNGKRLELLRQIVPRLKRVALIANPEHPGEHLERDYTTETARKLGIDLAYYSTPTRSALDAALVALKADPPQAVSVFADGFAVANRRTIIDAATALRVPVISGWPVFAQAGAICTYGPLLSASYERLAHFADRVLAGESPANLPIEQPTTFELVLNQKVARTLGLTLPPTVFAAADSVLD